MVVAAATLLAVFALLPARSLGEGGAEFFLDGVDDYLIVFPTFSALADWTIEAWLSPAEYGLEDSQCVFHSSTYSASNIFTLKVHRGDWKLTYGGLDLIGGYQQTGALAFEPYQQHVAVTHAVVSGGQANISLYVNGSLAFATLAQSPTILDRPGAFTMGACQEHIPNGLERAHFFNGHVDEIRHWSNVRTRDQIGATMFQSGPYSQWPTAIQSVGLKAQYSLDNMNTVDIVDTSGNSNNGLLGGWGLTRELPRYQRSTFSDLDNGAHFYEFRQGNFSCPTSNCIDLQEILSNSGYNGFLVVSVPTSNGAYLTRQDNATRLSVSDLIVNTSLQFHAEHALVHGMFELQPCVGPVNQMPVLSACQSQNITTIAFKVLQDFAPIAGERYSVQVLGDAGFIQLREQLTESGSIEFWAQLVDLDETQTLFSVTHKQTGKPMFSLSLVNGKMEVHLCTALPAYNGEQPFTYKLPQMDTMQQQHIAITWEYTTAVRGRAVYTLSVYQNCQRLHPVAFVIQDSCVHFGVDDSLLKFPTFGQEYTLSLLGLASSNFAAVHFGDIRVWNHVLTVQSICQRRHTFLVGNETGLVAFYPITIADVRRGDATLANRVPNGQPADLLCSSSRLFCPSIDKSRGYVLRPDVFGLPSESLTYETSAGFANGSYCPETDYYCANTLLPPLEIYLPAYDRDNYEMYDLIQRSRDTTRVKVTSLPDDTCGSLSMSNQTVTNYSLLNRIFTMEELPLYFYPNRTGVDVLSYNGISCATNMSYYAMDERDQISTYSVVVDIFVKVPGPLVTSVTLVNPRIVANRSGTYEILAGDIIAFGFDKPTTKPTPWQGLLTAVDDAFGSAVLNESWNDAGDVLMLEFISNDSASIVPWHTRFDFIANFTTPLRIQGIDSYPTLGVSPVAKGSLNETYCRNGSTFSKATGSCQACGLGNYMLPDGLGCSPCAPGTYAPSEYSVECDLCEPGTYMPPEVEIRSICLPADQGYFVLQAGGTTQVQCPIDMLAEEEGSTHCAVCPVGATCDNSTSLRTFASPNPGYFRTPSGQIVGCHTPAACKGGWIYEQQKTVCEMGMGGTMCQGCLDGWWRRADETRSLCSDCGWTNGWRVVLVMFGESIAMWFLCILAIDAALWGSMHAVIIRLALNYFTAISLVARIEKWELEGAMGKGLAGVVTDIFRYSLRFDGGLLTSWMEIDCLLGKKYVVDGSETIDAQWPIIKGKVTLWAVAPLVWIGFLVLMSVLFFEAYTALARCRNYFKKERGGVEFHKELTYVHCEEEGDAFLQEHRLLFLFRSQAAECYFRGRIKAVLQDVTPLCVVTYFVLIPTLLKELVVPLSCQALGKGGTEWRLLAAPEVVCWEGEHSGFVAFAIIALFLWCLLVPALMAVFLWKNRETLGGDIWTKSRVMWLSDGYEAQYVYWEFVVQARRVLLILISTWPDLSRPSELALYQVVGVTAVLLHLAVKPFDNRAGEMLDEVELYGLNFFQMLVMALQLVFLADPDGASYDLTPVFFSGALLMFSSLLLCTNVQSVSFFMQVIAGVALSVLLALSYAGKETRNAVSFSLVIGAYAVNVLYILWLCKHVFGELAKFLVETFSRARANRDQQAEDQRIMSEKVSEGQRSHHSGRSKNSAPGTLLRLPLPSHGKTCLKRLKKCFYSARSGSGTLIHFDTKTGDLVLGLHPETYMNDPHLSSYTRRMLARLGPFLTDEEREYIAMSLRDAIYHIIVECDRDRIHVSLLEFLFRITFAWKYHKRVLLGEKDDESDEDEPPKIVWGTERPSTRRTKDSKGSSKATILDLMFKEEVFQHGITASDFQAELTRITTMPRAEAQELLSRFFRIKQGGVDVENELGTTLPSAIEDSLNATPRRGESPDGSPYSSHAADDSAKHNRGLARLNPTGNASQPAKLRPLKSHDSIDEPTPHHLALVDFHTGSTPEPEELSPNPVYDMLVPPLGWAKARGYLKDLRSKNVTAGAFLLKEMGDDLDLRTIDYVELLRLLLRTKPPKISAESAVKGDGSDWNLQELSLLGDVSFAVPVTIFDNGAHVNPAVHSEPFEGTLLYTCGALLQPDRKSADWNELVDHDLSIIQSAYFKLYERRLLPCFQYANDKAGASGRFALITIPGLGCGQFAGRFQGKLGVMLGNVLRQILETHGHHWPFIHVVYYDAFREGESKREVIQGTAINYIVQPLAKSKLGGICQLCPPRDYEFAGGGENDDFSNCDLFSFVAWDCVSWPGNDYWGGSRSTDDGVKAAATDSMYKLSGIRGRYDSTQRLYLPPEPYSTWEDVLKANDIRLEVSKLDDADYDPEGPFESSVKS